MTDPKPIRVLAERMGGASTELKERLKRQRIREKALRTALEDGPKTVAELAAVLQEDPREALWLVMALKKYGDIVEGEQQGDVYTYALKR
ncbi:MAG: hypothetical protein JXB39_05860 [Deltaproteobacteria bacterium]|nr:hypothetical protein [Deltaproteobacteria bacterium]